MTKLTEHTVLARTRAQDLRSVRKLNAWGSELTDVSIVKKLPNVEVLSLSVNSISSLEDFSHCNNLQELYIRKNNIIELGEIRHLRDLPKLRNLWLADNPCAENEDYRLTVIRALPQLQKLDNLPVRPDEIESAKKQGSPLELLIPKEEEPEPSPPPQQLSVHTTSISYEEKSVSYSDSFTVESSAMSPAVTPSAIPNNCSDSLPSPRNYAASTASTESVYHPAHNNFSEKVSPEFPYPEKDDIVQKMNSADSSPGTASSSFACRFQESFEANQDYEVAPETPAGTIFKDHLSKCAYTPPYTSRMQQRCERPSAIRMLPKGGKSRAANILSAVLCLIKELDWASLEVVDTAIHCQMEELEEQNSS